MTLRKVFFWSHLAAGLSAGGVILFMALSGMIISFQPQIVEWTERGIRVVEAPAPGAARLSLDAILAKAGEVSPKGRTSGITVKSDPAAAVAVSFGKEGGNVYLNPYTGEVLGKDSKTQAALHTVEELHRWLGSREIGKPITGAACLFFFFLLLSGLYLWWPRKWNRASLRSSAVPSFKLQGKARDWNWHNTVGLWAAPLLLITTLTGTIVSYRWASDLLFVITGNEPPPRPPEDGKRAEGKQERKQGMGGNEGREAKEAGRPHKGKDAAPRASLDSLWARAENQVPAWSSINLRLPQKPGGPVTAAIIEPGFSRRYARSQLTLDAATAEVTKWEPYAEQNLGRRLRSWVVPLHTGRAGGPAGQFVALLSASAAALLVWTGLSMALRRFLKSRIKTETKSETKTKTREPLGSTVGSAQ